MTKKVTPSASFFWLLFLGIFLSSQPLNAKTYTSVQDGNWGVSSTWDQNNTPGCTVTDDIVIEDTVTCDCNPLEIKGSGSITIKSGGHLEVTSSTGITGDGDLTVESGGSLEVDGDLNLSGNSDFTVNGEADVSGDLTLSGSGTASGSGDLDLGGTGCSNWTGTGTCEEGAPLPVELISFDVISFQGEVVLNWRTASEEECDHYIVQRISEQGKKQRVGKVEGAGTTVHETEYRLKDREAPQGETLYYRLVQVDRNGERSIYGPVALTTEEKESGLEVRPNPVTEQAAIKIPGRSSSALRVSVHSLQGRVVHQERYSDTGSDQLVIDRGEISAADGVYLLRVQNMSSGKERTARLVLK